MKLKSFLAMMFLSFLSSSATVAAAPEPGLAYRKFTIYYGWYSDSEGRIGPDLDRIVKSMPEYVISPYYTSTGLVNLSSEVMGRFHENGIKVIVYIATGNAGRDLGDALAEIKTGLDSGADGVMLDEVAMLHAKWQVDYYKKIYDYVKSFGDKVVIANPGSILVNESVMSVSDILSFEHQWRLAPHIDWFSKYPATRFMGISSNDVHNVMGYAVDGGAARRDTLEAWQIGIGYHFATSKYTELPPWYEDYQQAIDEYAASGANLQEVMVRTVDQEGNEIKGLWIEVKRSDRVMMTGFSPAKFMLPEGTYEVGAADYQNFIFTKWQDGESAPYHRISVAGSRVDLAAVYKNELANLRVESLDNLGNSIRGMHISFTRGGSVVAEGETPLNLRLPLGSYLVAASPGEHYEFARWGSGEAGAMQLSLQGDTGLFAYYDNMLAGKLGSEIFAGCQDYQLHVVDSMMDGGQLAGILELQMRRSVMVSAGCTLQ